MKDISVITLSKIKKYDSPVISPLSITPFGRYLSKEMYSEILKANYCVESNTREQ